MKEKGEYIVVQKWMTEIGLKGNELLIYAMIYGYSQGNVGCFFGSIQYLADWLGLSRQSVINILQTLTEKGLLLKEKAKGNRIEYKALYNEQSKKFTSKKTLPVKKIDSQKSLLEQSKKFTDNSQKSLPNIKDNKEEDKIIYTPLTPQRGIVGYSESFEQFWKAYPNKKAKGNAFKAWEKLRKAKTLPELNILLLAIEKQKSSFAWTKDGGQYIPHPASWLNASRWDDEVTPMQDSRPSYAPDAYGRRRAVVESEQNFDDMPRNPDGTLDWSRIK